MARTPNFDYRKNILKSILQNDNSAAISLISKNTGISYPSIRNHIKDCISIGLLQEGELEQNSSGRGRKSMKYNLTDLGAVCLSFDEECTEGVISILKSQEPSVNIVEEVVVEPKIEESVSLKKEPVKPQIDNSVELEDENEEVIADTEDEEIDFEMDEDDEDDYDFESDFIKYKNSSSNFYEENNYKIKDEFDDGESTKDLADIFGGDDW
jgi:predicted ArsR family transcriptional regulator